MEVPAGLAWEIVVVDNNCTDRTAEVIDRFAAGATMAVRSVVEPRQGLGHARNRALMAAAGSIVAFTDDDCRVAPDWLAVIAREFAQDPALRLLGGRVELFNPADRAVTVRTARQRTDISGNPTRVQELTVGCNLVFRRTTPDDIGDFDTRFATPGAIPSADDLDFAYRVARLPGRAIYAPDLVVHHDHGRAADGQVGKLRKDYALGRGAFYAKHILGGDRAVARMAYWEVQALLAGLLSAATRRDNLRTLAWLVGGAAMFIRRAKAPARSGPRPAPSLDSGSA